MYFQIEFSIQQIIAINKSNKPKKNQTVIRSYRLITLQKSVHVHIEIIIFFFFETDQKWRTSTKIPPDLFKC